MGHRSLNQLGGEGAKAMRVSGVKTFNSDRFFLCPGKSIKWMLKELIEVPMWWLNRYNRFLNTRVHLSLRNS